MSASITRTAPGLYYVETRAGGISPVWIARQDRGSRWDVYCRNEDGTRRMLAQGLATLKAAQEFAGEMGHHPQGFALATAYAALQDRWLTTAGHGRRARYADRLDSMLSHWRAGTGTLHIAEDGFGYMSEEDMSADLREAALELGIELPASPVASASLAVPQPDNAQHRPRFVPTATGDDCKPFGVFDIDAQREVARYADSADVRDALEHFYGWLRSQTRAIDFDSLPASPTDNESDPLYSQWLELRADGSTRMTFEEYAACTRRQETSGIDSTDSTACPVVSDADMGSYTVARQHSGTEDGSLFYVLREDGSRLDGCGHVYEESARFDAADAAKLDSLRMIEAEAVATVRAQCPAPGSHGLAVVNVSAGEIVELRTVSGAPGSLDMSELVRDARTDYAGNVSLSIVTDSAIVFEPFESVATSDMYAHRNAQLGTARTYVKGRNAARLTIEGQPVEDGTRAFVVGVFDFDYPYSYRLEDGRTTRSGGTGWREDCARCEVNPSQEGSSLCDPCETGLEVAREEGSAAATIAAASVAVRQGFALPDLSGLRESELYELGRALAAEGLALPSGAPGYAVKGWEATPKPAASPQEPARAFVSVRGDVREGLNNVCPSLAPDGFGRWNDSQAAHVLAWAVAWAADCDWAEYADGSTFEEACEGLSAWSILRNCGQHYSGGLSALVRDSLYDNAHGLADRIDPRDMSPAPDSHAARSCSGCESQGGCAGDCGERNPDNCEEEDGSARLDNLSSFDVREPVSLTVAQALTIARLRDNCEAVNREPASAAVARYGDTGAVVAVVSVWGCEAPNPVVRMFEGGSAYVGLSAVLSEAEYEEACAMFQARGARPVVEREEDCAYRIEPGGTFERIERDTPKLDREAGSIRVTLAILFGCLIGLAFSVAPFVALDMSSQPNGTPCAVPCAPAIESGAIDSR